MVEQAPDRFLRQERTEPLTMNEVKVLGMILTRPEFEAVLQMQDPDWLRKSRPQEQPKADKEIIH